MGLRRAGQGILEQTIKLALSPFPRGGWGGRRGSWHRGQERGEGGAVGATAGGLAATAGAGTAIGREHGRRTGCHPHSVRADLESAVRSNGDKEET